MLLPPLEKSESGIRAGFTGVPVASKSSLVEEAGESDSESGLQEKKTVSAGEGEGEGFASAAFVAGFETRHSSFFATVPPPPPLQFSASSRDRGKTAIETPAGLQSLAGPRGKKGSGEGAGVAGGGEGGEVSVAATVVADAAKLERAKATTMTTTTKNAPSDFGRRGRASRERGRGMLRGVSLDREAG